MCDTNVKFAMPSSNDENVMVSCVIKDDVYTLTQQDINPEKDIVYRHFLHKEALKAPVSQGTIVGGIDIIYNGEIVGSAILVAGKSIESSNTLIRLDKLRSFFMGRFFILSISFFIIGILIYKRVLILKLRKNKNRKRNVKKFYQ